jgi:hypothetical protein
MQDRPNFTEILDAVRHFLRTEVEPQQSEHRGRFRTLVAINALTILEREYEQEGDNLRDEAVRLGKLLDEQIDLPARHHEIAELVTQLNATLSARIRRGDAPEGVLAHLKHVGGAKLRVASPQYLERYGAARSQT